MTNRHIEASVRVQRAHVEVVENLMSGQGAQAITLTDHGDTPIWEPGVGEVPLWGEVVITGLFSADTDPQGLAAAFSLLPGVSGPGAVRIEEVENRQWERAWMDRFQPMQFGRRLWIVPTGHTCPDSNATVLKLDPGLAFGTGTHATTRLSLEWLDSQDFDGRTVVDYGCGSGVLGIAAALLGARRVICMDNDPQAVTATLENARRNGVEDRLDAVLAERPEGHRGDIVIANILAGILVKLAEPLQAMVADGGKLALTGILVDQAEEVAEAYADRFPDLDRTTIDNWILLSGSRKKRE